MARFLHFSTNRFMGGTSIADFSESAAQCCTRCFVCGPAVREAMARSVQVHQFILQAVLVLLVPVELLEATANNTPSSCSNATFFHGDFEGFALLSQSVQGSYCFFGSCRVLSKCGAETSLSIVGGGKSPSLDRTMSFSVASATVESQATDARVALSIFHGSRRRQLCSVTTSAVSPNNCCSCVASRKSPTPVVQETHLACSQTCQETCAQYPCRKAKVCAKVKVRRHFPEPSEAVRSISRPGSNMLCKAKTRSTIRTQVGPHWQ